MRPRLDCLIEEYVNLVKPPREMSKFDVSRAADLLNEIVECDPNLYPILSSAVQQAPGHMAVDEAFVFAFRHPAVVGYVASAA